MKIKYIFFIVIFLFIAHKVNATMNETDLKIIMPNATSFNFKKNIPNLYYAYNNNQLIGICYNTTDVYTNSIGYNGPISILIGIYMNGSISGIKVLHHTENILQAKQIETKTFQNQFINKKISDPFKLKLDIDNIAGATITTAKLAQIIKNSALLVYNKYLLPYEIEITPPKNNLSFLPYLSIFIFALFFIILNAYLISKYKKIKKYNPFIIIVVIFLFEAMILFSIFDLLKKYVSNSINIQQLYKEKSFLNKNSSGDKELQSSLVTNNISNVSSNTEQSENEASVILNPKWEIQKINKEKVIKEVKNNNLSDKEALNYRETK